MDLVCGCPLWQISGLHKDNGKIQSSPTADPSEDDDSELKKIKKVHTVFTQNMFYFIFSVFANDAGKKLTFDSRGPLGAEFPTRLDVQEEVEDHHPGLHPVSPRREHEEEEPGGVQHAGL